jgi:hypothetical protein
MSRSSRELAITFIEIFNIHSFKDDLFNLIKNPDEDYNVRIHATHSLLKIVDEDFKKVLFKISSDHDFLDPSDKIKAIVLNSSWPVCITTEELFKVITPPKEVNIIGSYHMFLSQYLPEKLQATDLIYALNWVDHQFPRRHSADAYSWLISSIITKTIENLQESYVLKSFAKLFIKMSDSHYWGYDNRTTFILRNTLLSNIELKKELVSEIVNHLNDIDTRSEVLFYLVWDILVDKDLEWLIQCLKDEKDINRRVRWSNIIWEKFRFADIPKWIGLLYKNRELDKDLKGKIDDYVKPVSIDSKEPIREKELYYKINASLNIKKDRNDAQSFKEELSLYLEKADYQDPNIWFDIHNLIINYREYSVFDIIKSQGWKLIETKQKSKIMALANNFIKYYSPKKQEPTNDLKFIAQINAIRLVYIQDLNDFDDLIKNNINEWSFIVLIDSFINDAVFYKEIVNHLYIKYQPMILGLISEVIDIEIEQSSRINVIDKLDTCWDNDIADLLLDKLQQMNMHDKSWESILEKLLLFQNRKAKEILKSLINQPLTKTGAERVRVLIAGKLLMQYPTSDIWHTIWNAIINDNQFGKELLEQANDPDLCNDFLKCLDEIALFYLYIWLVRFYPYLDHEFASDHVRSCRDSVLNELKDRGTYRSCKAIKQIHVA